MTEIFNGLQIEALRATLHEAAQAAAKVTLPLFRNLKKVDNKLSDGFDPVTQADNDAEESIRAVINAHFPDHNIVGEEHPNKQTGSSFTWTIDPIDGTRSFISGVPLWGTLVGVAYEGKNFAGIMSQPFTDELYLALPEQSIWTRGGETKTNKTSGVSELAKAKLFTTTPAMFEGEDARRFRQVEDQVMLSRYGCDCYAYALLASGQADLVVEVGLNPYDIAALIPIIEEAGGKITTVDGGPADNGGDVIAAATPELHAQAQAAYQQG